MSVPEPRPNKPHTHTQLIAFTLRPGSTHTIRDMLNRARIPDGKRVDGFVRYHIEMVACAKAGTYASLLIDGRVWASLHYPCPIALGEPVVLEGDEPITATATPETEDEVITFSGTCFWNWPGTGG